MDPPTPLAGFCNLPHELVDKIVSHVTDRADLSRLSRTSKSIRAATINLLFETIDMVWTLEGEDLHQIKVPRINLLLRTLVERQEYAGQVLNFSVQDSIHGNDLEMSCLERKQPVLPTMSESADCSSTLDQAFERAGAGQSRSFEELRTGILNGNFDATLALILLLCTKMTHLTIAHDMILRNQFFSSLLEFTLPNANFQRSDSFLSLQNVRIRTNHDPSHYPGFFGRNKPESLPLDLLTKTAYLPLFYLPAIQHIELSLPIPRNHEHLQWPNSVPPQSSSLTSLHLSECTVLPKALRHLLDSTPNLASLEYDCRIYDAYFDAAEFVRGLDKVRNTLLRLSMSVRFWTNEALDPYDLSDEYVTGQCSLRNMIALKTFSMPACVLLGWNYQTTVDLAATMPPVVVSARIQPDCCWYNTFGWGEEQLMQHLRGFIDHGKWKTSAPSLRHLDISYGDWESADELHGLCERNDLTCAIGPEYPVQW